MSEYPALDAFAAKLGFALDGFQRTACERIFSQAVALGIERPKLRNQRSIVGAAARNFASSSSSGPFKAVVR